MNCGAILDPIYKAFGFLLKLCCTISGGYYIIALFIFTLIMQIVLFPLGIKQQKASLKMAKVKPKEMLIREKYKGRTDRVTQQKMQMEIQDLYRQEGTSMFGGCLPLLIQLPIILLLWNVIRMPLTYTTSVDTNTVTAQYDIAAQILDGGIAAIDASGLIPAETPKTENKETSGEESGAVSGTEESSSPAEESSAPEPTEEQKKLQEQQNNLKKLREECITLIKGYAGENSVDGNGRYNSANFTVNSSNEFSLITFIIYDSRDNLINGLKENGVSDELIEKYLSVDFSDEIREALPKFTYLGGKETLLDTPKNRGVSLLILIPVVIFITSVLSFFVNQKLSPMASMNANGKPGGGFLLKWGLPLFSAYLAWATFPAAVGMYWIYRTVLQIGQTYVLSKMYPVPVVTEAELEEYKRQMKAKKKKTITIEVDEDDTTYDHLAVKRRPDETSGDGAGPDPSSGYEMLKADKEDVKSKVEWAPLKDDEPKKKDGPDDKEG